MKINQLQAAKLAIVVVEDAIKSLGSVPSGHLYAHVMSHLSLDQYEKIIDILKQEKLIKESNHELSWIAQ